MSSDVRWHIRDKIYEALNQLGVLLGNFYTPLLPWEGGGRYIWITLSLCPALPRGYLLNGTTFCNQTWYGCALSWASVMWKICMDVHYHGPVSCEKYVSIFKVKVTVIVWYNQNMTVYYILNWTNDSLATKHSLMVDHQASSEYTGLLSLRSRSLKLSVVCLGDIFSTTQPFVTQLGIVVHHCWV